MADVAASDRRTQPLGPAAASRQSIDRRRVSLSSIPESLGMRDRTGAHLARRHPTRQSLDGPQPDTPGLARWQSEHAPTPQRLSAAFTRPAMRSSRLARPSVAGRASGPVSLTGRGSPPRAEYLFRAPGVQARVGLADSVALPGAGVEGAVIVYRDHSSAPAVLSVSVRLIGEVARRKENTSFTPGQAFRAQDVSPANMAATTGVRYRYARTVVPRAQRWAHGPREVRFHSACHPFTAVDARLLPDTDLSSSGEPSARADTTHFKVNVPSDAPPSHVWHEQKKGADVDLRYRIVATVVLDAGAGEEAVLTAEAVLLVAQRPYPHPGPPVADALAGPRATASRGVPGARRQLSLELERSSFRLDEQVRATVRLRGGHAHSRPSLWLVEVVYHGSVRRAERRIPFLAVTPLPDDSFAFSLETTGTCLAPCLAVGPLLVTHFVEAVAGGRRREFAARAGVTFTPGTGAGEEQRLTRLRAATTELRKQPPIRCYFRDEFPLFPNLDYENGAAGPARAVAPAAIISRLPFLTVVQSQAAGVDEEVCMVCLGPLADETVTRLTPCNHVLHRRCAQSWLRHVQQSAVTAACPMCKTELR